MAKQSTKQKEIVGQVMHEFKHGELDGRDGEPVKNPKQAIAIALHEAGSSNRESAAKNRRNLRRTVKREGDTADARRETRHDLYAEARKRNIPGRSKMTKSELAQAIS